MLKCEMSLLTIGYTKHLAPVYYIHVNSINARKTFTGDYYSFGKENVAIYICINHLKKTTYSYFIEFSETSCFP